VQNAQNIGLFDTVFEELVIEKSFIQTCNFLRSQPSDMISKISKRLQDRFIVLVNILMEQKEIR
jgi:hypothetical protein